MTPLPPILEAALISSGNALAPVPHVLYPCVPNWMSTAAHRELLDAMAQHGVAHCQTWIFAAQPTLPVVPVIPVPPRPQEPPVTTVPEPNTWSQIIVGLAIIATLGRAMRRKAVK